MCKEFSMFGSNVNMYRIKKNRLKHLLCLEWLVCLYNTPKVLPSLSGTFSSNVNMQRIQNLRYQLLLCFESVWSVFLQHFWKCSRQFLKVNSLDRRVNYLSWRNFRWFRLNYRASGFIISQRTVLVCVLYRSCPLWIKYAPHISLFRRTHR